MGGGDFVFERGDGLRHFLVALVLNVHAVRDGDTFHAAFLAHYTAGNDPYASARFAAQAAALKIERPPLVDQLPSRAEVLAALAE